MTLVILNDQILIQDVTFFSFNFVLDKFASFCNETRTFFD